MSTIETSRQFSFEDPSLSQKQRSVTIGQSDCLLLSLTMVDGTDRGDEISSSHGIISVVSDNDLTTQGEVDSFIRKKPTIAELAAVERLREKESGFVIESSGSEGEAEAEPTPRPKDPSRLTKNATIIHSGYFYKQGQVRKNWKQRYFELWSLPLPSLLSSCSPFSSHQVTGRRECCYTKRRMTRLVRILYPLRLERNHPSLSVSLSRLCLCLVCLCLSLSVQRGRIDLKASTITRLEVGPSAICPLLSLPDPQTFLR
jgi:hypothetical protein